MFASQEAVCNVQGQPLSANEMEDQIGLLDRPKFLKQNESIIFEAEIQPVARAVAVEPKFVTGWWRKIHQATKL